MKEKEVTHKWEDRSGFTLLNVRVVKLARGNFIIEGEIKKRFFYKEWVRLSSTDAYDTDYWHDRGEAVNIAKKWVTHYEKGKVEDEVVETFEIRTLESHPEHHI